MQNHIWWNNQGVGTGVAIEGIQRFFAWTYKDLKRVPLELAQQKFELDNTIPPTHQVTYRLNPNYVTIVKQDIDKLLVAEFIRST